MERYLQILKKCTLFYGVNDEELMMLLKCTAAEEVDYEEDEAVYRMGQSLNSIMILLKGRLRVVQENFWGQQEELYQIKEGEIFGESYSCARTAALPVSVVTDSCSEVLFLDYQRMITFCSLACDFHTRLIQNMLRVLAEQNVKLENKLEHMSRKTTREKLLSYLSAQAIAQGGSAFDIPHNRQELAAYLGVDRSAMSSELGRLRTEGLLDFKKNHFVLYTIEP